MIKVSVNKTKWSRFLARTRALILYVSGSKSYREFRETGPRRQKSSTVPVYLVKKYWNFHRAMGACGLAKPPVCLYNSYWYLTMPFIFYWSGPNFSVV